MNNKQARIEALLCIIAWTEESLASGKAFADGESDKDNNRVAKQIVKILDMLQRKVDRARRVGK